MYECDVCVSSVYEKCYMFELLRTSLCLVKGRVNRKKCWGEGAGIYVYDMSGRAINSVKARPASDAAIVNLSGVPAGTYMFLVVGRSKSASTKVIVE